MKGKWILTGIFIIVALLALVAGLAYAQGGGTEGGVSPQGGGQPDPYTTFTYQGLLKQNGVPVNDTCEFRFELYDATGTWLGTTFAPFIEVTDGFFTIDVPGLGDYLNGEARWLQVSVKCSGDSDYVTLEPRQPLYPVPHAMALPGFYTRYNDTSPNIIGGYSGNQVTSGVVGATIAGGGESGLENRVTDNYGTVGGGRKNQAGDNTGTTTDASYATVGGGYSNTASGSYATVGGGYSNTASGSYATVGGGTSNRASGMETTVAGGYNNRASGYAATVGGGISNEATATFATVPGGYGAVASHYGEMAYASGYFGSTAGNAQTSLYVLRGLSNSSDWLYLSLDGSGQHYITIPDGRTVVFDILVVGRSNGGESAGYHILGVAERAGGTLTFWPNVYSLHEDEPSWEAGVMYSPGGELTVAVKGNGETIRWVAVVRTAEVSW